MLAPRLDAAVSHIVVWNSARSTTSLLNTRDNGYSSMTGMQLFLDKLKHTPDGEGSLLDLAMVVYGSGISDGDSHDHSNLPTVVFGHGNGRLKTGRHVAYPDGTRMNRLFLTMMDCMGVPQENFSGRTEGLSEF